MQWRNRRQSDNVEDVRGMGGKGIALGGGGIGVLVLALVIYLCGGDPSQLLENLPSQTEVPQQQQQQPENPNAPRDENEQFARVVLADTEDVWNTVLPQQANTRYSEPKLVLFSDQVSSACGLASAAMGPFYCPGDRKLYLDFAFFRELKNEFKAPGDFAQAYVIAHEVGHHVQNLLGTMDKVQRSGNSNEMSVKSRTASRLLRRNLRQLRAEKRNFGSRRYGRSSAGGIGGRRRYDPTPHTRHGRSRFIHARLVTAKNRMVCAEVSKPAICASATLSEDKELTTNKHEKAKKLVEIYFNVNFFLFVRGSLFTLLLVETVFRKVPEKPSLKI